MKRKGLKAFLAMFVALALCISQTGVITAVKADGETGSMEPEGPSAYTASESTTLSTNIDVDDVLIKSGVTLTIGEGGYLAANSSFIVEEGGCIVTSLDYPVVEIREGVTEVQGFNRYVWNDTNQEYESYTGTGEAFVYQYMNIGTDAEPNMVWVRQDIIGPGPLDWFTLDGTDFNKELQFDLNIPAEHGSVAVSKINGEAYTKISYSETETENNWATANTAEFSDEYCNQTRIRINNETGKETATVEFTLNFASPNQGFSFDIFGEPGFRVERWQLEDTENPYDFSGSPITAYSLSESGMSAALTIQLTEGHTDAQFELWSGMRPGVSFRYDNNAVSEDTISTWLSTALTGIAADENDPNMYVFTGEAAPSIDFSGVSVVTDYKGFSYRVSVNEWDFADRTHVSKASSLTLDPASFYDIELRFGEESPLYDNTYCAWMDYYDNGFKFTVNDEEVNGERVSYSGDTIKLAYTLPEGVTDVPYVLMRYEFEGSEEAFAMDENPKVIQTDGYPVFFEIFAGEAEYQYRRLNCNEETDTIIEYSVGEHGSISFKQGGASLVDKGRATYGGRTRLIVDKNATIDFEITANEGYCIDPNHFSIHIKDEAGGGDINLYDSDRVTVAEDGKSASGIWNFAEYGDLNVDFIPDGGDEPGPGGQTDPENPNPGEQTDPENPNPGEQTDPENPNPGHTVTAEDAGNAIENHLIAYAETENKTVKDLAADELWNVFFGTIIDPNGNERHVGEFRSFFENRDAFDAAITIAADSVTEGSEITRPGTSEKLPYYEFTLAITDEVSASGRIYVLDSEYDMIVRTVKGSSTGYQVISATPYDWDNDTGYDAFHAYVMTCAYDTDNEGWPMVEVFGNGASFINISDSGNKAQCFGGHITCEQSGYWDGRLSYKLEIYNSSFEGVEIGGNGGNAADGGQGMAAAWSWFEMATVATNGTTASNPVTYNIFAGNTKIYLDSVSTSGSQKKITKVECSLPAAERAVRITGSGDRFILEPLSTFYTVLPLVITYEGGTAGYLTINIVAMDIQDKTSPGGSNDIIISHGTDRDYSFECPDRNAITATFYYTKDIDPEATGVSAILEATYTWQDGSVTRKTITESINRESWAGTEEPDKVTADDFILWQGTADNKPVRIEVIALKPDSADNDTFAGALFGGGAGITWTKD